MADSGWDEDKLANLFDEDGNKKKEVYLPIRPDGPITGAVWDEGKWIHVGSKRKRFDFQSGDPDDDPHTNMSNPKKKARFMMKVEQSEIEELSRLVKRNKPPRHVNPIALLQASEMQKKIKPQTSSLSEPSAEYPEGFDEALDVLQSAGKFTVPEKFDDLPISQYTKHMLAQFNFTYLTDIQKAAIPHCLVGRDVLGAAKTGSGKTLAFVIPIVENLYRKAWHTKLGLGALVLAPTRELALQIFRTVRMVGRKLRHLSAGLAIGGKHSDVEEERKVIGQMTILVATPGRLINHLEKATDFTVGSLQMLVLDEADLMLEIGLLDQVQTIMDYLPRKRQTMLFSATLTINVVKLSKVSLRRPVFLPVDAGEAAIPKTLVQTYVEVPLQHKYNLLWSFMQTHLNDKMIVFFATLRQVKFTRRMFVKLRPFASIVCLHSEMRQNKRMAMYTKFKQMKNRAVLLATEVASRGLDFPNVDWVINFEPPTDAKAYIHRVGRAARLGQKGNSITFLIPNELAFVDELKKHDITVKRLGIKDRQLKPILGNFRTVIAQDQKMAELARKAFCSFLAFYYYHGNPAYMDPERLDKSALAFMFGLMHTPKYDKFLKRVKAHKLTNMPNDLKQLLLDTKRKKSQKEQLLALTATMDLDNPLSSISTTSASSAQVSQSDTAMENDDIDASVDESKAHQSQIDKHLASAAANTAMNVSGIDETKRRVVMAKAQNRMIIPDIDETEAPKWFKKAFEDRPDTKTDTAKLESWLEDENGSDDDIMGGNGSDQDLLESSALQAILDRD